MKKIAILGSTGSIGTQTLEIVRANQDIEVLGLAAGRNICLLEEQIREFHPKKVAVWDEEKAKELRVKVSDLSVDILCGMDGMIEIAQMEETESNCRTHYYATCKRMWCSYSSCRQRT